MRERRSAITVIGGAALVALALSACGSGSGSGGPTATLTVERVSLAVGGAESAGPATSPAISADGRFVAFASSAGDLAVGAVGAGTSRIYRFDRQTRSTTVASTTSSGVLANAAASGPLKISADGRYVAFTSIATNLDAGDTATRDVYLKDLTTGTTTRVSKAAAGGDADSFVSDMTPDGRYVLFISQASNLVAGDTNAVHDLFRWDRTTGAIVRVSLTDGEGQPDDGAGAFRGTQSAAGISDDGDRVAFGNGGVNLTAGDTNARGDIYVRAIAAGTTTLVSLTESDGQIMTSESFDPDISGDGTRVSFISDATDAVAGDLNGNADAFVRDLVAGTTVCVSRNSDGTSVPGGAGTAYISRDGTRVVMTSSAALTPGTGGIPDIYLRRIGGGIVRVSVGPGGARGDAQSLQPALSDNGLTVAFSSLAGTLVAGDGNSGVDVFVATVPPSGSG